VAKSCMDQLLHFRATRQPEAVFVSWFHVKTFTNYSLPQGSHLLVCLKSDSYFWPKPMAAVFLLGYDVWPTGKVQTVQMSDWQIEWQWCGRCLNWSLFFFIYVHYFFWVKRSFGLYFILPFNSKHISNLWFIMHVIDNYILIKFITGCYGYFTKTK